MRFSFQVVIPSTGARLVMASDGLWDRLRPRQVISLVKYKDLPHAAHTLLAASIRVSQGDLIDDTTVLLVDIVGRRSLHSENSWYPGKQRKLRLPKCFCRPKVCSTIFPFSTKRFVGDGFSVFLCVLPHCVCCSVVPVQLFDWFAEVLRQKSIVV